MSKCKGCGLALQFDEPLKEGYSPKKESEYCQRCFKLIHYGASDVIEKKNITISKDSTVLYVLDITNISNETLKIINNYKNIYVILTKKDLLPKSVRDYKLINYIKDRYKVKDIFIISSKKKYNIDSIYNKLVKDKIKEAYVIGYTSSGKSSLINALLQARGLKATITVSNTINTTIDIINIKFDDFMLHDTPGLINEKAIYNYIDKKKYKDLLPKKEIKPKIYALKKDFMLLIGNTIRIENNTDKDYTLVLYLSNLINIDKMRSERNNTLKEMRKVNVKSENQDIVIEGLGFIKTNEADIDIYVVNESVISLRDKLI